MRLVDLSPADVTARINGFSIFYNNDWTDWIYQSTKPDEDVAECFAFTLRKWAAVRPNTLRRPKSEKVHAPPHIDDLINSANKYQSILASFSFDEVDPFNTRVESALTQLWQIFLDLSYKGPVRNGKAGIVGISKAIMLLSYGNIGPAIDSSVGSNIHINVSNNSTSWIDILKYVHQDIQDFQHLNKVSLKSCAPEKYRNYGLGRLYDMVFGPR